MKQTTSTRQSGFTLVELAIVLVIIGLIVGGVLVGQDLIKAAEVRATVSQIEKYNTSVNTFRDKYKYIPGDLGAQMAARFGFETVGRDATADGQSDQDGRLECGIAACNDVRAFGNETALFWRDLNSAGLIAASTDQATGAVGGGAGAALTPAAGLDQYVPEAAMGRGNYVTVFSAQGTNFYQLTGINTITPASGAYALEPSLSPQEAFNIDDKVDDGMPARGSVRALQNTVLTSLNQNSAVQGASDPGAATAPGVCVNSTDTDLPYNTVDADSADSPACILKFRFN
jgi:prepilin-type N-terminal cleavage/methylation domain-containing protein